MCPASSKSSQVEVPSENRYSSPAPASSPVRSTAPSPPSIRAAVQPSINRAPAPTGSQHAPLSRNSPPVVSTPPQEASLDPPSVSPSGSQQALPGSSERSPNESAMLPSDMDNETENTTQEGRRDRRRLHRHFNTRVNQAALASSHPWDRSQVTSNPARHASRASPQVSPRSTIPQRSSSVPTGRPAPILNFLAVPISALLPVFEVSNLRLADAIQQGRLPLYEDPRIEGSVAVPIGYLTSVFGIPPSMIDLAISHGHLTVFESNPWPNEIYQYPINHFLGTRSLISLISTGAPFTTLELIGARRATHGNEPIEVFLRLLNDELRTGRILDLGGGSFQFDRNHPTLVDLVNREEEIVGQNEVNDEVEDEGYAEQSCELCANNTPPSDNYIVHPDRTYDILERNPRR